MGFVRATVLGLTLCLTAGVPGTAAARGKASQADRAAKKAKRKAKRYEKKGKKAYAKGRWDDAIAEQRPSGPGSPRASEQPIS